ncbi:MAG TPA: nitrile hydratase subunit beta [Vicinamibacterales bacterium]|nr:nitrile hydratase subunit beta [Vicinamibacterales bacterium]
MNGIHDMGGMHGMGPIQVREDERPFHAEWEGRAWGLIRAAGPFGPARRRNFRYEHEVLPPAQYLQMQYYERFIKLLIDRLMTAKLLTQAELDSGRADPASPKSQPRVTPAMIAEQATRRRSLRRDDLRIQPGFTVGQDVRARNINPVGHTRLPRYMRGHRGTIVTDHGIFDFQDTDADGYALPARPQHVYTVSFTARELWGETANARDTVHAELWEDYLERA